MAGFNIRTFDNRCSGCLRCQLACSHRYTGVFNPSKARIMINTDPLGWRIVLTESCNGCGICVDHCFYDALAKESRGKEP